MSPCVIAKRDGQSPYTVAMQALLRASARCVRATTAARPSRSAVGIRAMVGHAHVHSRTLTAVWKQHDTSESFHSVLRLLHYWVPILRSWQHMQDTGRTTLHAGLSSTPSTGQVLLARVQVRPRHPGEAGALQGGALGWSPEAGEHDTTPHTPVTTVATVWWAALA